MVGVLHTAPPMVPGTQGLVLELVPCRWRCALAIRPQAPVGESWRQTVGVWVVPDAP